MKIIKNLFTHFLVLTMFAGITLASGGGSTSTSTATATSSSSSSIAKGTLQPNQNGRMGAILLHGWGNLFDNGTWASETLPDLYWAVWNSHLNSKGIATAKIKWDTKRRIDDQWYEIVDQFVKIHNSNHCINGCVVFTHSTGGMIFDMLMARAQESRGTSYDYSRVFNESLISVNLSSAAGGSDITQIVSDLAHGAGCGLGGVIFETMFSLLLPGFDCSDPGTLGVTYDLIPTVARQINRSNDTRTPSLMIAGFGTMLGGIMKPFLLGEDDGVAPMHSTCGSTQHKAYESCSPTMGPDGHYLTGGSPVSYAAPAGFYKNHYPFLMTKEGHGSELARGLANEDIFSTKTETLIKDDLSVSTLFNQIHTSGTWFWEKKYRRVQNDTDHLSTVVINNLKFL